MCHLRWSATITALVVNEFWQQFSEFLWLAGTIPVYVYTPNNLVKDAPIFIYFHGGGMVVGCRENVETTCQIISAYNLCSPSQFKCLRKPKRFSMILFINVVIAEACQFSVAER